ncbi:MAG: VWA domain-containing protein, partial [Gemmataceae bacterium]
IGGPEGFGAGGWQNTPVEKALPVDCDIKSLKVQGKGGLVMIMHASEMADGNRWQKKIAKLAVERLGPADEVGIIDYDFKCKWPVPMAEAGPHRAKILAAIDGLMPGDMPDFDPALQMAFDALTDPKKDYGAKHVIIISDGDPVQNNKALLRQIKAAKITIATVGVATHGAPQDAAMEDIATAMPGDPRKKRYYKVTDPSKLPAIYIKETRLVSQAFVHRKEFGPLLRFRTEPIRQIPELLPLGGFVRTTPKPSPLVEVPVMSPKFNDQDFPVLAHWHYGLGKGVAFTSDAGKPDLWCRKWTGDDGIFARFWEQVLGWSLRPTESGKLLMTTEVRDGKVRVVIEARAEDGRPDSGLRIEGGITPPSGKGGEPGQKKPLAFVQKNAGQYEAEVKAEEAGSYFIAAQAVRKRKVKGPDGKVAEVEDRDGVRAGVTLPYSPEFSDLETNAPLLRRLVEVTNEDEAEGRVYEDDADALLEAAKKDVFRAPRTQSRSSLPFHYWLLFFAAGLLLIDVAARRLAFDRREAAEYAAYVWARLRGRPVPPPERRVAVERLSKSAGGGRRLVGAAGATVPERPAARPAAGGVPEAKPQPAAEAGDTLDALARAKKKVWEDKRGEPPA